MPWGNKFPDLKNDPSYLEGRLSNAETSLAQNTQQLLGFYNVKSFKCSDGQYVQGDGVHDDTTGIQSALDTARGALIFPKGIYKVTGTSEACLTLNNNVNLIGLGTRDAVIRADNVSATTSILKVAITNNWGYGDVRNWQIKNLTMFFNGGGLHALLIKDGLQLLTCNIEDNNLAGNSTNGGNAIYVTGNLAHSRIALNQLTTIYMGCYDANMVEKNLFSDNANACTYDLITGVRNNTFRDNTVVNRDGVVHIVNGSNIRIQNNQCEQPQSVSQNPHKCMVWIEGVDTTRQCQNIVISENNFGGGTNLDRLIYMDNTYKSVVEKNNLIAVNIAEIELTANAKYCIIRFDNNVVTQVSNPRTKTSFKANITDNGVGTAGVLKDGSLLNRQNSWTGGDFYKDENGIVHFYKTFNAGTTPVNTVLGTLPVGFRPSYDFYITYSCSGGTGILLISSSNGNITASTSIPSNLGVSPRSFPTGTTD